jgi:predicted ATP-dependent Lon-type protease
MKPTIGEVFVAGGAPTVTYVPRDSLHLEKKLGDYLDERYRLLSLSGPTKSGKTVLVRRVIPGAVLVPGGNVDSPTTFWEILADKLNGYSEETRERTEQSGQTDEAGASVRRPVRREG